MVPCLSVTKGYLLFQGDRGKAHRVKTTANARTNCLGASMRSDVEPETRNWMPLLKREVSAVGNSISTFKRQWSDIGWLKSAEKVPQMTQV